MQKVYARRTHMHDICPKPAQWDPLSDGFGMIVLRFGRERAIVYVMVVY